MNPKKEELIIILVAFLFFAGFLYLAQPSLLGFSILSSSPVVGFVYNDSIINATPLGYQLAHLTTTTSVLEQGSVLTSFTSAYYDFKDKTDKVDALDSKTLNVEDDEPYP